MSTPPSRRSARLICGAALALASGALSACSTAFLGTPDTSNAPIPPPRASPFARDGAGSSAPSSQENSPPLQF